ncbi:hypothetical protein FALCPG4_012522 [Fusarium falciforme]
MIIPIVGLTTPGTEDKSRPVGIAITFLVFLFGFFYKPTWGATTWIYTTEIFPLKIRGPAVGMSVQMHNVANAIFQQFFPTFYQNEGLKTFFFTLPETKRVPLEEMDSLFGGVSHVEKGAATIHDVNAADAIGEPTDKASIPVQVTVATIVDNGKKV